MKFKFRNVLWTIMTLLLMSCSISKNDFTKQKYTRFSHGKLLYSPPVEDKLKSVQSVSLSEKKDLNQEIVLVQDSVVDVFIINENRNKNRISGKAKKKTQRKQGVLNKRMLPLVSSPNFKKGPINKSRLENNTVEIPVVPDEKIADSDYTFRTILGYTLVVLGAIVALVIILPSLIAGVLIWGVLTGIFLGGVPFALGVLLLRSRKYDNHKAGITILTVLSFLILLLIITILL